MWDWTLKTEHYENNSKSSTTVETSAIFHSFYGIWSWCVVKNGSILFEFVSLCSRAVENQIMVKLELRSRNAQTANSVHEETAASHSRDLRGRSVFKLPWPVVIVPEFLLICHMNPSVNSWALSKMPLLFTVNRLGL